MKPKIKSASEYYVVEQTYCHFSRGRSLPKSNGETGRLFFGVCPDSLPHSGRGRIFHRPVRVAATGTVRGRKVEIRSAAGALPRFLGGGCTACQGDRSHDQPRRQGDRIYSEGEDGGARPFGLQGVRAFRPHFAGHQQHLHSADYQGCARGGLLPREVLDRLREMAREWHDVPMLARTHGQPASPTRLGKEMLVFVERLEKQLAQLRTLPVPAKFGGATGNFNAHHVAYPAVDWVAFANGFVNDRLGLERSQYTTQIEHYDNLAAIFDNLKRIDTVLIDLCRDMWMYISMEYFKQRIKAGEVGSSAMPHKVNPIDFENAEGNFGIANAIYEHLASKLPLSRLQRDLTDSTVLRNVGVPMAHSLIGLRSLLKGLNKLLLNREALDCDLENNWAVVAEGIQTVLRRAGYPSPYEALKALTRTNAHITRESIAEFIESLDVAESVKQELRAITPQSYTGVFE